MEQKHVQYYANFTAITLRYFKMVRRLSVKAV